MVRSAVTASVLAALILPVLAERAEAQPGFISGVVRDAEGSPIAGAEVTGENVQWDRRVETITNADGRFSFVGLQTGRWLFIVRHRGYAPVQGFANARGSGQGGTAVFVMEPDPLHPPAPSTGVLAHIRADEVEAALDAADALFDAGNYDGAIDGYRAVLADVPSLTSLNLQIGHAYRAKNDDARAIAAWRAVTAPDAAGREAEAAIQTLEAATADR